MFDVFFPQKRLLPKETIQGRPLRTTPITINRVTKPCMVTKQPQPRMNTKVRASPHTRPISRATHKARRDIICDIITLLTNGMGIQTRRTQLMGIITTQRTNGMGIQTRRTQLMDIITTRLTNSIRTRRRRTQLDKTATTRANNSIKITRILDHITQDSS